MRFLNRFKKQTDKSILMSVYQMIKERTNDGKGMLFSVIDPLDHATPDKAIETAVVCAENGADVILVGGSVGVQGELLDYVVKGIKDQVDTPVVLFPGNISTITKYADAIYFMSMLNSRDPYWITGAQTLAAFTIKQMGIEAISTGYVVVEPGGTVGWVGDAKLIPRNKPMLAAALGLAAEMLGFELFITDVGSAAQHPVPIEMVRAVRKTISLPYIVAGGIRSEEQAFEIIKAGADAIQVGTAFEGKEKDYVAEKVKRMKNAVLEGAKKRF